jgi:hypothetical protein
VSNPILIGLVIAALGSLAVLQVISARAAKRLGGRSANAVITLRIFNAVAVVGLVAWLLWDRFGR